MTDARLHIATTIKADMAAVALPARASFAAPAGARHAVIDGPAGRQPPPEGHHTESVRDASGAHPDCGFQTAGRLVPRDRRHVVPVRCVDDASRTWTLEGHWRIDPIAGRGLILVGPRASPTRDDGTALIRRHNHTVRG